MSGKQKQAAQRTDRVDQMLQAAKTGSGKEEATPAQRMAQPTKARSLLRP